MITKTGPDDKDARIPTYLKSAEIRINNDMLTDTFNKWKIVGHGCILSPILLLTGCKKREGITIIGVPINNNNN